MASVCPAGHSNDDASQFCATCGALIVSKATPPPPPPISPYPPQPAPPAYQQPGYQQPGYGQYAPQPSNGMGVAALVLGILSVLLCSGYGVLSVLAIVFGAIGLGKANRGEATNRGMALWGLWLGIASIVIGVIAVIVLIAGSNSNTGF